MTTILGRSLELLVWFFSFLLFSLFFVVGFEETDIEWCLSYRGIAEATRGCQKEKKENRVKSQVARDLLSCEHGDLVLEDWGSLIDDDDDDDDAKMKSKLDKLIKLHDLMRSLSSVHQNIEATFVRISSRFLAAVSVFFVHPEGKHVRYDGSKKVLSLKHKREQS